MKQDRIAYELSTPCRNDLKGKKIMVVIGEQQSDGYVQAPAAELRAALPGDQRPPALARACAPSRPRRSARR
jgi:hypothetical protein